MTDSPPLPEVHILQPQRVLSEPERQAVELLRQTLKEHEPHSGGGFNMVAIDTTEPRHRPAEQEAVHYGVTTNEHGLCFIANIQTLMGTVSHDPELLKAAVAHEAAHVTNGNLEAIEKFGVAGTAIEYATALAHGMRRNPALVSAALELAFGRVEDATQTMTMLNGVADVWRKVGTTPAANAEATALARMMEEDPAIGRTLRAAADSLPSLDTMYAAGEPLENAINAIQSGSVKAEKRFYRSFEESDFITAVEKLAGDTAGLQAFTASFSKAEEFMADRKGAATLSNPKLMEDLLKLPLFGEGAHAESGTHPASQERIERLEHVRMHGSLPPDATTTKGRSR